VLLGSAVGALRCVFPLLRADLSRHLPPHAHDALEPAGGRAPPAAAAALRSAGAKRHAALCGLLQMAYASAPQQRRNLLTRAVLRACREALEAATAAAKAAAPAAVAARGGGKRGEAALPSCIWYTPPAPLGIPSPPPRSPPPNSLTHLLRYPSLTFSGTPHSPPPDLFSGARGSDGGGGPPAPVRLARETLPLLSADAAPAVVVLCLTRLGASARSALATLESACTSLAAAITTTARVCELAAVALAILLPHTSTVTITALFLHVTLPLCNNTLSLRKHSPSIATPFLYVNTPLLKRKHSLSFRPHCH